jgi:hypothetical protein
VATLIDELIVSLNLDTSKFTAAQNKALEDAKKYVDELKNRGNEVESWGKRIGDVFQKLKTEAVAFAGVAFGGYELRNMIERVTSMDASLLRLSQTMRILPQSALVWANAMKLIGASSSDALAGLQKIGFAVEAQKQGVPLDAGMSQFFNLDQLLGPQYAGRMKELALNGGPNAINDILLLAQRAIQTKGSSYQQASFLRESTGLPEPLIQLLTSKDFGRLMGESAQLSGKMLGESAAQYVEATGKFSIAVDNFTRTLSPLINLLTKYVNQATGLISGDRETWLDTLAGGFRNMMGFGIGSDVGAWLGRNIFSSETSTFGRHSRPNWISPTSAPAYKGDPRHLIPFIRATAASMGIDPDVAVRVAQTEGLASFASGIRGETSWGAFQLHTGGGLGDDFRKQTGLDPSDPANEMATIKFALAWAKTHGWGYFHGAANNRIGPWVGIDRGAGGVNNSKSVHIGTVNIHAPDATARGIARSLKTAVIAPGLN